MDMNPKPNRRVRVQIDCLMLKGLRYGDRYAVALGIKEQLTRLLSEPGMVQKLGKTGNIPSLRVGQVHVQADSKPHKVGIAAANGIGKAVGR
jgi:hypothetical protein